MYFLEMLINVFLVPPQSISSLDSQPVFLRTVCNKSYDVAATYGFECMMQTPGL